MTGATDGGAVYQMDVAAASHPGTERPHNEDCCGVSVERVDCVVLGVADGVSSENGGEVASQMAIEITLRAFREAAPEAGAGQRLYRAVQQANIDIHDRAIAVPELRGMATTLTAVSVERGAMTAVHVGDSRLYLLRDGSIVQLTKDHTVAAEKARFGLITRERARTHADRSTLTRSVGHDLIVSRDRVTRQLMQGDVLVVCSDGLYNVLGDPEIAKIVALRDAASAARALIEAANARGTPDNVTAAVLRVVGPVGAVDAVPRGGLVARIRRLLGHGPFTRRWHPPVAAPAPARSATAAAAASRSW